MNALESVLVEARELGLLGPGPIDRHIEHARGFVLAYGEGQRRGGEAISGVPGGPYVPEPGGVPQPPDHVLDLGSGGGLPGLVLATVWPRTRFALLDAGERRTAFLQHAVEVCDLTARVRVLRGRAEDIGRQPGERSTYGLVVARSFGLPAVTAECAAPFLRPGGVLITSEPPGDEDGDRWSDEGLATLGLAFLGRIDSPFRYRIVEQVAPCPDRFPRRVGVPAKRPLF